METKIGPRRCTGSPPEHTRSSRRFPQRKFLKALAVAEIGLGAALLTPVVPNRLAGAALSAFSGGLVTMYLRTPAMHKPNSVWPTPAGTAVSKDVWMLGIGLGLLAEGDGDSDLDD
jgi:uncharacterized membrane protein YkgB